MQERLLYQEFYIRMNIILGKRSAIKDPFSVIPEGCASSLSGIFGRLGELKKCMEWLGCFF